MFLSTMTGYLNNFYDNDYEAHGAVISYLEQLPMLKAESVQRTRSLSLRCISKKSFIR